MPSAAIGGATPYGRPYPFPFYQVDQAKTATDGLFADLKIT